MTLKRLRLQNKLILSWWIWKRHSTQTSARRLTFSYLEMKGSYTRWNTVLQFIASIHKLYCNDAAALSETAESNRASLIRQNFCISHLRNILHDSKLFDSRAYCGRWGLVFIRPPNLKELPTIEIYKNSARFSLGWTFLWLSFYIEINPKRADEI